MPIFVCISYFTSTYVTHKPLLLSSRTPWKVIIDYPLGTGCKCEYVVGNVDQLSLYFKMKLEINYRKKKKRKCKTREKRFREVGKKWYHKVIWRPEIVLKKWTWGRNVTTYFFCLPAWWIHVRISHLIQNNG